MRGKHDRRCLGRWQECQGLLGDRVRRDVEAAGGIMKPAHESVDGRFAGRNICEVDLAIRAGMCGNAVESAIQVDSHPRDRCT